MFCNHLYKCKQMRSQCQELLQNGCKLCSLCRFVYTSCSTLQHKAFLQLRVCFPPQGMVSRSLQLQSHIPDPSLVLLPLPSKGILYVLRWVCSQMTRRIEICWCLSCVLCLLCSKCSPFQDRTDGLIKHFFH